MSVECIRMCLQNNQNGKCINHYTIAEFTHLFVDIGERCLSVSISHWEARDFSHERTSHALTPDHFRMTVILHAIT